MEKTSKDYKFDIPHLALNNRDRALMELNQRILLYTETKRKNDKKGRVVENLLYKKPHRAISDFAEVRFRLTFCNWFENVEYDKIFQININIKIIIIIKIIIQHIIITFVERKFLNTREKLKLKI